MNDPTRSPIWRSLAAEAGIAADQIGEGVTMLGEMQVEASWTFPRAFFPLSIGLERTCKLVLQVEARLHAGLFLDEGRMRTLGHNLGSLFHATESMTRRLGLAILRPTDPIHTSILEVLTDFASGGRYHHLDNLAGRGRSSDPAKKWWSDVITPMLAEHYKPVRQLKDSHAADLLGAAIDDHASVLFTHVDGTQITTIRQAALATYQMRAAVPWTRMHTLQLVRWLAEVADYLTEESYSLAAREIPVLNDFYAVFRQRDSDLRTRKGWRPSKM